MSDNIGAYDLLSTRTGPVKNHGTENRNILGVEVCAISRDDALIMIEKFVLNRQHRKIAFLNAHGANITYKNDGYRKLLGQFLVLADGVGLDLASKRLYGEKFPDNLNGTDFLPRLLHHVKMPMRVGLLGGKPGVADKAAMALGNAHGQHSFIPIRDGYFPDSELSQVMENITDSKLDMLLVAFGNPLQEQWVAKNCTGKHCTIAFGVGAYLDFSSGRVQRAPQWLIKFRLEWLFRLWREPSRMWQRYLIGSPLFIVRIFRQKIFGFPKGK